MIVQVSADTLQVANNIGDNIDATNPLYSDPEVPTDTIGLGEKETELNSYTYAKSAFDKHMEEMYLNRDSEMREQHIIPAADITNGDFSQANLNAIDAQIQKLNKTTRVKNPFATNDQLHQQIKNKIYALQSEVEEGKENVGMIGNMAAGIGSWFASIPYSYKKSLVDAATFGLQTAGVAALGAATGGISFAADAALQVGLSAADNAYDAKVSNKALKDAELKQKSLVKAGFNGAVGAVAGIGIGVSLHAVGARIISPLLKKAHSFISGLGDKVATDLGNEFADKSAADLAEEGEKHYDMYSDEPSNDTKIEYNNMLKLTPEATKMADSNNPLQKAELIDNLRVNTNSHEEYTKLDKLCKE